MDRSSLLQRTCIYYVIVILLLLLVFQFVVRSKAQDNLAPYKIDGPVVADQIDWTTDSQSVIYLESGNAKMVSADKIWRTYNLASQTITTSNTWPFYPQLSANEVTAFQPANSEGTSSIYVSPDNGYIAYAGPEVNSDETTSYSLQIGSRATLKFVALQARIYAPDEGRREFDALWNKDSNAFAVSRTLGGGDVGQPAGVVYVSKVTSDLSQLSEKSLDDLQIGSVKYFPFKIFGFSPDGRFLLAEAVQKGGSPSASFLLLYDTNDPASSKILYTTGINQLVTASFDPSGQVLILADGGVSRINLNTQVVVSLTQAVDSNKATNARFSPDGNWLAFSTPELDFDLLNLTPVVSTNLPISTATATFRPVTPKATFTPTTSTEGPGGEANPSPIFRCFPQ